MQYQHKISLAAVIVTFNRLEKLKQAVTKSLQESLDYVVVVNNASTDGTGPWLKSLDDPRIHVITLPTNQGGAGGFHEGFKYAHQSLHADWLVCFDDDAYPAEGSIDVFKSLNPDSSVGIVSANVRFPSGKLCEMNRPGFDPFRHKQQLAKTILGGVAGFHLTDDQINGTESLGLDWCSFVGCFVRVSMFERGVEYPRKELFVYHDDMLFTLTVSKLGYGIVFEPSIRFIHDCESLNVGAVVTYTPLWKAYYTYRNGILVYRYVSGVLFPAVVLVRGLGWMLKSRHYSYKRRYLSLCVKAIWDGLTLRLNQNHSDIVSRYS